VLHSARFPAEAGDCGGHAFISHGQFIRIHVITGAGIDLFDVARIDREVARHGASLLDELFTPSERAFCLALRHPARGFAIRYAAKEACFKALGTGKIGGMSWHDIQVTTTPHGTAEITLRGETAREADAQGIGRILVTTTTTPRQAVAWVLMGTPGREG